MIPLKARLHQTMTICGINQNSASHLRSSNIEGSFAHSIAITSRKICGNADIHPLKEEWDSSSCSSSSSFEGEEDHVDHQSGYQSESGSFPTFPPPTDHHVPLPVVFEEEDEDLQLSTHLPVVMEEEDEDEDGENDGAHEELINTKGYECKQMEHMIHDKLDLSISSPDNHKEVERTLHIMGESQDEQNYTATSFSAPKATTLHCASSCTAPEFVPSNSSEPTSDSLNLSSSKTICSNTDTTCQTMPFSISQDSLKSDISTEFSSAKHLEDELDSRLNAIIALKEVVFTQRMTIKSSTKENKRLSSIIKSRERTNQKLHDCNSRLKKELALVKEQLQIANSRLLKYESKQEVRDDSSVKEQESIFVLLQKVNDARKNEPEKKNDRESNVLL